MNLPYLDIIVDELNDSLARRKNQERHYLEKIDELKRGEKSDYELLDLMLAIRQLIENPELVMEVTVQDDELNIDFLNDSNLSYRSRCQKLLREKQELKANIDLLRTQIKEQRGKVIIHK